MADDDNWDDLVLTEEAFHIPPSLRLTFPSDPTLQSVSSQLDDEDDWASDFAREAGSSSRSSLATHPVPSTSANAGIHFIPGSAYADKLSKEEEDQSSTDSSRTGTIRSLLGSFAGLSLASPTLDTSNNLAHASSSDSLASAFASGDETLSSATPRPSASRTTSGGSISAKSSTVRKGSALSQLLASAASGPGKVIHLGSTTPGRATAADDWDADLDLDSGLGLELPRERMLRAKSSFASHISDNAEDELLLLPTPKSSRKNPPAAIVSPASSAQQEGGKQLSEMSEKEDEDLADDFDLPEDEDQLGGSLKLRPSLASLGGSSRRGSSQSGLSNAPPALVFPGSLQPAPPSRHSTSSPALSYGEDTSETDADADDDAAFFQELVLPSYFLGQPGQVTPPSEGETFSGRVDLQAVLKRKLAQRSKAEQSARALSPTAPKDPKLDGYVDKNDEDADQGLVIGNVRLNGERMRTRSAPAKPMLKQRATSGGTTSSWRRSSNGLRLPTALAPVRPLSTASSRSSSLTRGGSSSDLVAKDRAAGARTPSRPNSAQGAIERHGSSGSAGRERRTGPPPAPSTAARDRVRARTLSLRPSSSAVDLRAAAGAASVARRGAPPRIDTAAPEVVVGLSPVPSTSTSTSASPIPLTPVTPSPAQGSASTITTTAPALRRRTSSTHLLAPRGSDPGSAPASRTLARQRSLQNISSLSPASTRSLVTGRSGRPSSSPSPVPGAGPRASLGTGRTTPIRTGHFAQPTAASVARVRERVNSNPSTPSLGLDKYGHIGLGLATARPSSAASGRIRQPTMASQAKVVARPVSMPATPTLSGLRIPSAPLNLAKPKRAVKYGDGSELDGFDDLPTSRDREMRVVARSYSSVREKTRLPVKAKDKLVAIKPVPQAKTRTHPTPKTGTLSRATSTSSNLNPSKQLSSRPSLADAPAEKAVPATPTALPKKKRVLGHREPQLIRNLGSAPKQLGEMKWNAAQGRWDGNERSLRAFDSVVSSSARPALITNISIGSLSARDLLGFPVLQKSIEHATKSQQANVRVVGGMVFDPVRMSWHAIDGEDDELDLLADEDGAEQADDEGDRLDGWARGEEERMLKNRASFVASEVGAEGGEEGSVQRAWREVGEESIRAEERHAVEMGKWAREEEEEEEGRGWLFDLQTLVRTSKMPAK